MTGGSVAARLHEDPLPGTGDVVLEIEKVVRGMAPVSLPDLGDASLLDRIDSKFLLSLEIVPGLLQEVSDGYRVLEVEGIRLSRNRSLYFDTPEYDLYRAHHAGRIPRYKVRIRRYGSSGTTFLEVKRRSHGGRTRKARVILEEDGARSMERLASENLLGVTAALPVRSLSPAIEVEYHRITLVGKELTERVSIDLLLGCRAPGDTRSFPGAAIVEVKQPERRDSPMTGALRRRGLRRRALSKYCLSLASLKPELKRNRFKPAFERLERIGTPRG
jgi:hypothetical protein